MTDKKQEIITIYNKKLVSLSTKFVEEVITTSFGKTNVLVFGDETKPKLFLVHGLNSAAPFAFDTVSFLVDTYQIFAIDILGQTNKSDFVRLNKKDDSYGEWLKEVVSYFKFDSYSFCGISFGAFPIIKSLLINEEKVEEVFLISPAGIINGSVFKTIFRFLVPMKKYQITKNENDLKKCLQNLYDVFDQLTLNYQKEVFLNFKMDFSITPNFSSEELSKVKTPITIISSKNDFFVPTSKLKKKSKKITSLKNFIKLENSKHIPAKEILKNAFTNLISKKFYKQA